MWNLMLHAKFDLRGREEEGNLFQIPSSHIKSDTRTAGKDQKNRLNWVLTKTASGCLYFLTFLGFL